MKVISMKDYALRKNLDDLVNRLDAQEDQTIFAYQCGCGGFEFLLVKSEDVRFVQCCQCDVQLPMTWTEVRGD